MKNKSPGIRPLPSLQPHAFKVRIQKWRTVWFKPALRMRLTKATSSKFNENALGKRTRPSMCGAHPSRASWPAHWANRLSRAGSTHVRFPTKPKPACLRKKPLPLKSCRDYNLGRCHISTPCLIRKKGLTVVPGR